MDRSRGQGRAEGGFRKGGSREIELSRADRTIRSSSSEREKKTGKKEDEDALKTELAE